mgnify:CR=1 FL=1
MEEVGFGTWHWRLLVAWVMQQEGGHIRAQGGSKPAKHRAPFAIAKCLYHASGGLPWSTLMLYSCGGEGQAGGKEYQRQHFWRLGLQAAGCDPTYSGC